MGNSGSRGQNLRRPLSGGSGDNDNMLLEFEQMIAGHESASKVAGK